MSLTLYGWLETVRWK